MKRLKLKVDPTTIKSNKNGINLFELGTLLQFETHAWQARKRLPTKIAKLVSPKAKKNFVRANKDLIDKSHLLEINSIIGESRRFVADITNPFPIKGIHFISNNNVPIAKEHLNGYIAKLKKAVNVFIKQYQSFITEAEDVLGIDNLFDPTDYPKASQIRNRFDINYRLFDLSIPSSINQKMQAEESANFKALMEQTKEMGILALREGFADIVNHLTTTLQGKVEGENKRLRQNSIDKISQFFESFQSKNVFEDTELENIIKDALLIIEDVDSSELRKDKELTKIISKQLGEVKKELDKSIITYKRKVSFI